jgi:hypothetical protein
VLVMPTVIFVHGTGVRADSYGVTLKQISASLLSRRPDVTVRPCLWGEHLGSRLHFGGESIPAADRTRDILGADPDDDDVMLWSALQDDPLLEMRLLAVEAGTARGSFHPTRQPPGRALDESYRRITASAALADIFSAFGLAGQLNEACNAVLNSPAYADLTRGASLEMDVAWTVVIRATVAQALLAAERSGVTAAALYDTSSREALIATFCELADEQYRSGPLAWTKRKAVDFAAGRATASLVRRRSSLSAAASPLAGDILLYQRDGTAIRDFVRTVIERSEPPVVLLAHSLGGVVCLDLLASTDLPVALLVTVGTPAPLFYELDALRALRPGEPLPGSFPTWLNIYDQRDLLANVASGLFGSRVTDKRVDNGLPFHRCHGAYWYTDSVWDAITGSCP